MAPHAVVNICLKSISWIGWSLFKGWNVVVKEPSLPLEKSLVKTIISGSHICPNQPCPSWVCAWRLTVMAELLLVSGWPKWFWPKSSICEIMLQLSEKLLCWSTRHAESAGTLFRFTTVWLACAEQPLLLLFSIYTYVRIKITICHNNVTQDETCRCVCVHGCVCVWVCVCVCEGVFQWMTVSIDCLGGTDILINTCFSLCFFYACWVLMWVTPEADRKEQTCSADTCLSLTTKQHFFGHRKSLFSFSVQLFIFFFPHVNQTRFRIKNVFNFTYIRNVPILKTTIKKKIIYLW